MLSFKLAEILVDKSSKLLIRKSYVHNGSGERSYNDDYLNALNELTKVIYIASYNVKLDINTAELNLNTVKNSLIEYFKTLGESIKAKCANNEYCNCGLLMDDIMMEKYFNEVFEYVHTIKNTELDYPASSKQGFCTPSDLAFVIDETESV